MTYFKHAFTGIIALTAFLIFSPIARAEFNPGYIIGDQEILDDQSMTQEEIQNLLVAQGGFLATYPVVNPDGLTMTAAQAIYDRARNNHVNPKFIIVLLQKEQSLIEDKSPSQGQLDRATGYGCPDSGGCNDRWKGFWKQINSASLQFRDYMDNPQYYHFVAGQTYTIANTGRDPMVVTIVNQATAALYNYTPHVYNGNFNFWKIWQRYFTREYLNGSLLQAKGDKNIWLIQDGQKRAFSNIGVLASRFDVSRIQIVSLADLDKYPTGETIKFAQYSIVRVPNGRIYLLVDNNKRRILSPDAFKKLGFNAAEIIQAADADLASYTESTPLTAASNYPTGALLQDKKTGGIYWISEGTKSPLWDAVLLKTKFKGKKIIRTTTAELANYQTIDPIRLTDGDIVKTKNSPAIYIIENGLKRAVWSAEAFIKLGYKWTNVITVSDKLLSLHADGDPIILE
ncbi:MAG: hypothetical protein NTY12_03145 [Candidatus Falkowbacteria bacterium]|nr:hypothetical protein [Candidatus Falkowbacteria bacterium]